MEAATVSRKDDPEPADRLAVKRGQVSKRITWNDTEPFPGNHIFEGRMAQFQKRRGGYVHHFIGTPEIFDNGAGAFPEYPLDTLFVGDGNHRRELAARAGKLDESFIANIHRGLSRPEMFAIREASGDRRTVRPPETFLARVEQKPKGPEALIKADVEGLGWRISVDRENHAIRFTNELAWTWTRSRAAMIRAIQSWEQAFGTDHHDSQGIVLKGLGAFWIEHGEAADFDRVVSKLRGATPAQWHESGRLQRQTAPSIMSVYQGVRYSLVLAYNRGLGKGRALPVR